MADTLTADIPTHVPRERVVDVNIFDLPGGREDPHEAWLALRRFGKLIWTPQNGGHWIVTDGAMIESVYRRAEIFSNAEVGLPPGKFLLPLLPIQLDGADHARFRALIEPAFRPTAVARRGVEARALAASLAAELAPRGACEFVSEFAMIMPLSIFLSIVDLPVEDRVTLHGMTRRASRSPTQELRGAAFMEIVAYLESWIERRRVDPGPDLLSGIIHARIDDEPLTHQQVLGTAILLLFAGLDTVAAMMAFVIRHLATHPDDRRWIIANPSKISFAAEELMRRHGVANNVRTVVRPVELDGVALRPGDIINVPNSLHGLDDSQFERSAEVDFERPLTNTGTFGWGPHRCAGANLARLEMRIMLEEWLRQIPEFEIDPEQEVLLQTGTSNSVLQLPLRWVPRPA